eukprot:s567_g10.t1
MFHTAANLVQVSASLMPFLNPFAGLDKIHEAKKSFVNTAEQLEIGVLQLKEECCTDAGTCSEFLNGTSLNASNSSNGCGDGFVAMQSPPEFCAGAQCQNYDCCLRTAEAMASVQTAAITWDSIQVTWSVPTLNNCTFQEYQVQLMAENSSNSTWQEMVGPRDG